MRKEISFIIAPFVSSRLLDGGFIYLPKFLLTRRKFPRNLGRQAKI